MAEELRAALIGCGRMGQYHLHALLAARGLRLTALADPSQAALDAAGDLTGVPPERRYRSYEEMLAQESLDVVDIATQAPVHAPATIAAAGAGVRAILCEKPIALELAEADRMVDVCEARGVVLAINHTLRQGPGALLAHELIERGDIGEPLSIHFWDKGGRPAGVAFMEMATHCFDLVRYLGGDVEWVSAHLWNTRGDGAPRLAAGADAAPSQVSWPPDRDCGPVLGDRGSVTFMLRRPPIKSQSGGALLPAFYEAHFQPAALRWRTAVLVHGTEGTIAVASAAGGSSTECFIARHPVDVPPRFEPLVSEAECWFPAPPGYEDDPAFQDGFPRQIAYTLEQLAEAARAGRPLSRRISTGHDGRAALEMIMGIYAPHLQEGRRVTLPLTQRTHPLRALCSAS